MAVPIKETDLMRLGASDERFEVANGVLLRIAPNGVEHALIAGYVYRCLRVHCDNHVQVMVLPGGLGYVLEQDTHGNLDSVRVPDVSFIRWNRVPKHFDLHRLFPGAP